MVCCLDALRSCSLCLVPTFFFFERTGAYFLLLTHEYDLVFIPIVSTTLYSIAITNLLYLLLLANPHNPNQDLNPNIIAPVHKNV